MASRVWLLVEWVDESNMFPSYGVVNVDTLTYDETDLHPGNIIFLRVIKHENARRAKILRISENKRYVKEQREILERQDQQVKNVIQLCMRTIKEMKTENSFNNSQQQSTSKCSNSLQPHVIIAQNDNSDSDSEPEHKVRIERPKPRSTVKPMPKYPQQYSGKDSASSFGQSPMNANNSRNRSIVSSTPLPSRSIQERERVKLFYDQGTQTSNEETFYQPPEEKIEQMETVLKHLYKRFQYLVSQVNMNSNGSTSMSESEHNDEASYIDPHIRESWVDPNNSEYVEHVNYLSAEIAENVGAVELVEQVEENVENQQVISSNVKNEELAVPEPLRVRRMSAQTTNNIETMTSNNADMVPIGNGNAKVPARLLHDIDWNSHTNATRQLLQAIFPRRILATHSLTGKASPAFLNKPPKKILDPQLVEDIVKTVSARCGVPKNLVRNSITIKCTDEAKLFRNRQRYKHSLQAQHQNEENMPPSTPSSDESNAVN